LTLGGTNIASIASATYSPYWAVSEKNVIVVSGTTGDTSAWLNGNAILTSGATAWSPSATTSFYLGASAAGAQLFDGILKSVKIFKSLLTVEDAEDYYTYGVG
jgi:hypothetical protein